MLGMQISFDTQGGFLPTTTGSASLLNGPQAAEEGSAGRLGAWGAGRERPARRCSSGVEQLTCNQQVVGSTPTIGSRLTGFSRPGAERYPSGQREQTVSL